MNPEGQGLDETRRPSSLAASDWLRQLALALETGCLPTILGIGVIGNALSFTVMSLKKNRSSVMYFHLRVLAVSDTVSLATFLPKLISPYIIQSTWIAPVPVIYCTVVRYFSDLFFGAAMWLVVIIAVDRVIAVSFPLRAISWCTMGRAKRNVIVFGVLLLGFNTPNFWRRPKLFNDSIDCVLGPHLVWFDSVTYSVNAAIPVSLILILNITIIISVRSHSRELKRTISNKQGTAQDGGMTAMLILVATTMVILNTPYFCLVIMWTYIIPDFMGRNPSLTYFLMNSMIMLWMVNNSINFFLYCLASKHFRKDLRQLFNKSR
ncbi:probable G-protein coupled receptor 139 [Lineus longissimus]|uniref:probable G-protein coupled receptor 139 n=1 Tax=Lineus longissimus TaxID=88925 RepID=UPI00315D22AC